MRRVLLLLLLLGGLVSAAGSCCRNCGSSGNTTNYYNVTNVSNYFNDFNWFESGGWLNNNLTVAGLGVNVTGDLLVSGNINSTGLCLEGYCISNWSSVNGSGGGVGVELDPWWSANESRVNGYLNGLAYNDTLLWSNASEQSGLLVGLESNASAQSGQILTLINSLWNNWTILDLLRGYAQANYTVFESNASVQSGQIQTVNDSAVHKFGDETIVGDKLFNDNVTVNGTGVKFLFTDGALPFADYLARANFIVAGDPAIASLLSTGDSAKGGLLRGEKVRIVAGVYNSVEYLDNIFGFEANAWDGVEFFGGGALHFDALETWGVNAHGTSARLSVTPVGGTTSIGALAVNGSGIVDLPFQSSVRVWNNSASSTISAMALITWNRETFDTQNEFTANRFTAKQAGIYEVKAQIPFARASTTKYLQLRKNGTVYTQVISNAGEHTLVLMDLVSLAAGGYLEVWASATAANNIFGGTENMTFSVMKVA